MQKTFSWLISSSRKGDSGSGFRPEGILLLFYRISAKKSIISMITGGRTDEKEYLCFLSTNPLRGVMKKDCFCGESTD
jgi:hypothetical protein